MFAQSINILSFYLHFDQQNMKNKGKTWKRQSKCELLSVSSLICPRLLLEQIIDGELLIWLKGDCED